jgi:hypothetical protein
MIYLQKREIQYQFQLQHMVNGRLGYVKQSWVYLGYCVTADLL